MDGDNLRQIAFKRLEHQAAEQLNHVARREVFSRFLVVFLVETSQQFLKQCSHLVVAHRWQRQSVGVGGLSVGEVYAWVGDALNDGKQTLVVGELFCLVVVVEVFQHVFHVGAEAVEIFHEVVVEYCLAVGSLRLQSAESPFAAVVVVESCHVGEVVVFHLKTIVFKFLNLCLNRFLRRFKQCVNSSQNHHWQNNVTVLTTQKHVAKHVVGNVPYQSNVLIVCRFHLF